MCEVTKILNVKRYFGPTKNPFFIEVLNTSEAEKQAFYFIWQQVFQVDPIISAQNIFSNEASKKAVMNLVYRYLRENIAIGCYSLNTNELIAVDVLKSRQFHDFPLQQDEFKGKAYGNFIKYLNVIHKHVQDDFQKIDRNNYYLTSLGVFTKPRYNNLGIFREMIFTRKLVARGLRIEFIATPFIGKEMQGIAKSCKYEDLKVLNREEMLQLGLENLTIREELPIKIMKLKVTITREINTRIIFKSQLKNEVDSADKVLRKVHFTNIRGLHSNINPVRHHLETEKPDLLFLTAPMIAPPSNVKRLNCSGYLLKHKFRRHAGVCVYVREGLHCNCTHLPHYEDDSFSTLWLLVDTGFHKTIYVGVYRSPSDGQETRFFNHLKKEAKKARKEYQPAEFVFLGDFNAHHKEWLYSYQKTDTAGTKARKFSKSLRLMQLVTLPTRVPDVDGQIPNCLDLLLTTDPDRYSVSVMAPLGSSDHCLVKSESSYSPPDLRPSTD